MDLTKIVQMIPTRFHGRAGAQSAPALPLMLLTPPGIPPPGIVSYRLFQGSAFYTSWPPHSSGGPRGAAVLRPSHVESSIPLSIKPGQK